MKRVFLLVVVPALLVALGFAQTPAASVNTDQTIKGCLGGSDGNYTVVEDGSGHIFKISAASVDFKQHLGHDVTLIGHTATGVSSAAVDNSFVVTALNMISENCAVAAAAPVAAIGAPPETSTTPPTASAASVATSTLAQNEIIPVAPTATTVTAPAEIAVPPPTDAAATVSTPWDKPVAAAADPTRPSASSRRLFATSAAVATTPAVTASTPDALAVTPAAAASTPTETASAPDAAPATPAAPARHGALLFLILLTVLVIVTGTLVLFLGRWRKRRMLERTGAENLSFTREASPDQDKPDQPRKAA